MGTTPMATAPAIPGIPHLDAQATRSADGTTLFLSVINYHPSEALPAGFDLGRTPLPGTATIVTLAGEDTHTPNTVERQDLVRMTQHDRFLDEDYARLVDVGIRGVREGVPWYRIDRRGRYDFRPALPLVEAGQRYGLTQIWDLFHYGFPTYLHPFSDDFVQRFADYCYAFARYLIRRTGEVGTRYYTPLNEPSFYAWAGGEVGWFAPFERGRGFEYKLHLA